MLIDYDFTMLVNGTPAGRRIRKTIILSVSGTANIEEVTNLQPVLTLKSNNNSPSITEYFMSDEHSTYRKVGTYNPQDFTDLTSSFDFFKKPFQTLLIKMCKMSYILVKRAIYPPMERNVHKNLNTALQRSASQNTDASIDLGQNAGIFRRAPFDTVTLSEKYQKKIEIRQTNIEKELNSLAIHDGNIYKKVSVPLLFLIPVKSQSESYQLHISDDYETLGLKFNALKAIGCFSFAEMDEAKTYPKGRINDPKLETRLRNYSITFANLDLLDTPTYNTTLRLIANRIIDNYGLRAETAWTTRHVLVNVPIKEIQLYRKLRTTVSDQNCSSDKLEHAIYSCLNCTSGKNTKAFDWNGEGIDNLQVMIDILEDKTIPLDTNSNFDPLTGTYLR